MIPGLSAGGAERVMSILANEFSFQADVEVHLCLYAKPDIFYELHSNVFLHKINFNYKNFPRLLYTIKIFSFIRKKLREIKPGAFLSFNSKYNSLVLTASLGLGIKGFVSDRSRPGIKYGLISELINPFVYRWAHGIIAQTNVAKEYIYSKTHHKNIIVIPNPVASIEKQQIKRENIILNVGRFITSKNQKELINIFMEINPKGWSLVLVGEGPKLDYCKTIVEKAGFSDRISFIGNTTDVQSYYQRSKVFAFPSTSEGFPNALAEAMSAGCACLSFNCIAGPADLINHKKNGYLVETNNLKQFKQYLEELIKSPTLVEEFSKRSVEKVKHLNSSEIADKYRTFILQDV